VTTPARAAGTRDGAHLGDGVGEGFLAEDVLAAGQRRQHRRRVSVIGGADEDGVDPI